MKGVNSFFSCIKRTEAAEDALAGVPSAGAPSAPVVTPAEIRKIAELDEKIKKLEGATAPVVAPVPADVLAQISSIDQRLKALEGRFLGISHEKPNVIELEERVRQIGKSIETSVKSMLEADCEQREKKAMASASRLDRLELEFAGILKGEDEVFQELRSRVANGESAIDEICKAQESVYERELAIERALEEGTHALKSLMAEERRQREMTAVEAAEKLEVLEKEIAGNRQETGAVVAEVNRRKEEYPGFLSEANEGLKAARGRVELFESEFKKSETMLKLMLAEEHSQREVAAAGAAERFETFKEELLSDRQAAGVVLCELGKSVEECRGGIAEAFKRGESLERALKTLLDEERRQREKIAVTAEERLEKLDKNVSVASQETGVAMSVLSQRVEECILELAETRKWQETARERGEALELALKKGETALNSQLSAERGQREEFAAEASVRFDAFKEELLGDRQAAGLVLCELGKSVEECRGGIVETFKRGESLERALKTILDEERRQREKITVVTSERLEKLDKNVSVSSKETGVAMSVLSQRVEECSLELAETRKWQEAARERGEELERALKKGETALNSQLSAERGQREEFAAEASVLFEKLEKEVLSSKIIMDELHLNFSLMKEEVNAMAKNAFNKTHEHLEALVGKMRSDILAVAESKLLVLESAFKTAEVNIRDAQKAAFYAMERCEKLDKGLFLLDYKTGALEKKYSHYLEDSSKPCGSDHDII